jgi:hypothetical protein
LSARTGHSSYGAEERHDQRSEPWRESKKLHAQHCKRISRRLVRS